VCSSDLGDYVEQPRSATKDAVGGAQPDKQRTIRRRSGSVLRWANTQRWRLNPPDYNRSYRLRTNGFEIVVLPTVFHPRWHFTSSFFARTVEAQVRGNMLDVLEVGTGTGLVAMSAARHARRTVAVDLNPTAVRCAKLNALNNDLGARVEVYQGDMFAPVEGQRFSLIACNPPYFSTVPRTDAQLAYAGGANLEWLSRLAREARDHLLEGGAMLCVFGSAANVPTLVGKITAEGWERECIARRQLPWEELTVWRFTRT